MKTCVLVSGGVDSTIAYWLAKKNGHDVYPLFVDLGHPYAAKERVAVQQLIPEVTIVSSQYAVGVLRNEPTVDKQEIYARNLLLATFGAQLAPTVWLSALETETTPLSVADKQPRFFEDTSRLLTFLMRHKHGAEISVTSPFLNQTKTDVVAIGLSLGLEQLITQTTSCYEGSSHSCGACSTCFKRYVAFTNNHLTDVWESDPRENEYGKQVITAMQKEKETGVYSGRFTMRRYEEMEQAGFL